MIGVSICLNWAFISKLLNVNLVEFVAYFISLPCIVLFLLSYMTTTTKYLYRHLYIPLSREELEINNVHTLEEYDKFLAELFMGNKLLNKAHKEVITTATKEFKSKEENNDDIVLHMIYTDFYIGWYFFFYCCWNTFRFTIFSCYTI